MKTIIATISPTDGVPFTAKDLVDIAEFFREEGWDGVSIAQVGDSLDYDVLAFAASDPYAGVENGS